MAPLHCYKAVLEQKCLFPKKAKEAANQLKKLGVTEIASIPPARFSSHAKARVIEASCDAD